MGCASHLLERFFGDSRKLIKERVLLSTLCLSYRTVSSCEQEVGKASLSLYSYLCEQLLLC
jgi:hypothetical protein